LKIGIVAKPHIEALKVCNKFIKYALTMGLQVHVYIETLKSLVEQGLHVDSRVKILQKIDDTIDVDVLAIVGGNGTLLRTLHRFRQTPPLILTIRYGRRGFLLDVGPDEIYDRLKDLINGNFFTIEYIRLKSRVEGKDLDIPYALNEVAVLHSEPWSMIRLNILKDSLSILSIDCDGILIATPAGSTAYSLAAGGPIIEHDVDGVVITPIATQQLNIRPIVVKSSSLISIEVRHDSRKACLVIDGVNVAKLDPGNIVKVSKAPSGIKVIRFSRGWFYERLYEGK